MDPLSEVLTLLKPRSYLSAGLQAGGDWALKFPAPLGIKFNAVVKGSCWVSVEGGPAQYITEGDCFLLTRALPFVLSSDPALVPIDSSPLYAIAKDAVAICNGGGDFFLVGGRFAFSGDYAQILFEALPAVLHVPRALDQASVLRWSLDQLTNELHSPQIGSFLVAEHIVHLMLVQVLRLYLTAPGSKGVGWVFALSDRQLGPVLSAIHATPGRPWTLDYLAEMAGMSRSLFAQRFRAVVGRPPIEYLTRWRMLIAADRLKNSHETVAAIAHTVGYESEGAFSTAFKRIMACPPSRYCQRAANSL